MEDRYESPDEEIHTQFRSYIEFKLPKHDEDNIKSIEDSLDKNKISAANKKDLLDYLLKIHKKISDVKKEEYKYEGENNDNLNEYLDRISTLRNRLINLK